MNIKSLLLGSAAALAVVSGAQAADAVVAAEPEPMEYVKVCDAYGTGYFYIPGTETCLKVGGRVRVDMQAADSYTAGSAHGWRNRSRAELYMDSASDTEYGALKTNFVARWDFDGTYNDGAHTNPVLIAANISIAGLLAGQADSQYSSFIGYAGDIINDDVISYGGFEINQLTYTYDSGAGLKIMGSLEDDRKTFDGETGPRSTNLGASIYKNGRDYLPNLVGGVLRRWWLRLHRRRRLRRQRKRRRRQGSRQCDLRFCHGFRDGRLEQLGQRPERFCSWRHLQCLG